MDNSIFREKSVKSISSPDSLNDYIRVVSPSVWLTLAAIIVLLAGLVAWGALGRLDTNVGTTVRVDSGKATICINEKDEPSVTNADEVTINGRNYRFDSDASYIRRANMSDDKDILEILGSQDINTICCFDMDTDLSDGTYEGVVKTESVSPISFVIN